MKQVCNSESVNSILYISQKNIMKPYLFTIIGLLIGVAGYNIALLFTFNNHLSGFLLALLYGSTAPSLLIYIFYKIHNKFFTENSELIDSMIEHIEKNEQ